MNAYLGQPDNQGSTFGSSSLPDGSIQAALLTINDTTAPGSAPPLSSEAFAALSEGIRVQITNAVPLSIVKVLDNNGITPNENPQEILALAEQSGVKYLMVVIISSNESEVPTYLPINGIIQGGGMGADAPGYEAQNFALAEMSLLNSPHG